MNKSTEIFVTANPELFATAGTYHDNLLDNVVETAKREGRYKATLKRRAKKLYASTLGAWNNFTLSHMKTVFKAELFKSDRLKVVETKRYDNAKALDYVKLEAESLIQNVLDGEIKGADLVSFIQFLNSEDFKDFKKFQSVSKKVYIDGVEI